LGKVNKKNMPKKGKFLVDLWALNQKDYCMVKMSRKKRQIVENYLSFAVF